MGTSAARFTRELTRKQRNAKILAMRVGGSSYTAIAKHFSLSQTAIIKICDKALASADAAEQKSIRALAAKRFDVAVKRTVMPSVRAGDLDGVSALVSLESARAKMFGVIGPDAQALAIAGVSTAQCVDLSASIRDLPAPHIVAVARIVAEHHPDETTRGQFAAIAQDLEGATS